MNEIIKLEGLNKTFRSKQNTVVALDDVNLSIYEGEIFGIIGLSGAGKSTLVRCINLLERPTEGKVWVRRQGPVNTETKRIIGDPTFYGHDLPTIQFAHAKNRPAKYLVSLWISPKVPKEQAKSVLWNF